jgi:UDP-N-acetylmuramyl pentapeptide phosphotransferase/UDP-N-acetylglucosamine-1-phosphate transferase
MGRVDYTRFLFMPYLQDSGELTVFCISMVGALIGFLWYNTYPAKVFMGDTGSLALGGGLGAVAILLKSEFVLAFVGAVFVAEMMSGGSSSATRSSTGSGGTTCEYAHAPRLSPRRCTIISRSWVGRRVRSSSGSGSSGSCALSSP